MNVPAEVLASQIRVIFQAWGMAGAQLEVTVQMMLAADLRGIDSHGIATLWLYDEFRLAGKLTLNPEVKTVRDNGMTALIDGGGGLGHFPSAQAMALAIEKCATHGIGAVGVRNS